MSRWLRPGACAMVLAASLAAPGALAQPSKPAGPSAAELAREKEIAKEWANKGRDRFEQGDYAGAIEALREAERHFSAATILRLRAEAHEKLGQLVEARNAYRQVAEEALPAGAAPALLKAQANAKKALVDLEERIPTIEITITGAPPGSVVKLDGAEVAAAELARPVAVDPGRHAVTIELSGKEHPVREVTLAERAREQIVFDASALAAPPGGAPKAPPPGRSWLLPGIAFGAGGAGLVMGAVTGILTVAKMDEVRRTCGEALRCPEGYQGEVEGAKAMGHASTVGFILGGLGVAAGVVVLAWPAKKASPASDVRLSSPQVGLQIGPGYAGVKGVW